MIIGGFLSMFMATIVIVVILLILIIGSAVFKEFVLVEDSSVAFDEVSEYMKNSEEFIKVKYLVKKGVSLDEALVGGGYDE